MNASNERHKDDAAFNREGKKKCGGRTNNRPAGRRLLQLPRLKSDNYTDAHNTTMLLSNQYIIVIIIVPVSVLGPSGTSRKRRGD